LAFNSTGSKDSTGGTNITYSWNFSPPSGVTLGGTGITGPDSHGVYHSSLSSGAVDVSYPTNVVSEVVTVSLTVIEGANCTNNTGDIHFTVEAPLRVSIVEKGMTGSNSTVTLTGAASPSAGTTYHWQRLIGSTYTNIAGATNSVLSYSSFEADATPSIVDVDILSHPYQAKLYEVTIRLHAERTVNSQRCTADSDPLIVRKIIAVDP
jgi:hypothetical protein